MKQQESVILNKASTLFLKLAIFSIGAIVLALCVFALPAIWQDVPSETHGQAVWFQVRAILIAFYVGAVPFYIALFQSLKLLGYIDKGKAFSNLSVGALKVIAWCGVAISAIFVASLPFFYVWADRADAPGLIPMGMILACAAFTVTVFAAVMQRLLKQAIEMKQENELTV
ncbi:DUF2975 domain-containing protein [Candidatus Saccharibacteria bacterium]|nr:MAG: DUF2975 domain-containing protein [Candidatus Saccharibacteria bacterium]